MNDYYIHVILYMIFQGTSRNNTMSKTSTVHIVAKLLKLFSEFDSCQYKPSFCVALDFGIYKTALNVSNKIMTSTDFIICQICY